MNLTSLKCFLNRSDGKTVIISTLIGGVLQYFSKRYIKNHPEIFSDKSLSNKPNQPKFLSHRGGEIISILAFNLKIIASVVIQFLAEKGMLAGLASGSG